MHALVLAWLIIATVLWLGILIKALVTRDPYSQIELEDWENWSKQTTQNIGKAAGVSSMQGRRPHMEDTYRAAINLNNDEKAAYYAVYDGHGGPRAAVFTAENLHRIITSQNFHEEPQESLKRSFLEVDMHWLQMAETNSWDDGTTAISCLIVHGTIYVANVGDSRAVLASNHEAIPMSSDHKPDREDEKMRIENLGGRIIFFGTWRVEGMLAVTRAIGDRKLKKYVSAEPEIRVRKLQEGDDFLILASDGVWDVLSNQEAVDIVYRAKNVKEAADTLTETAYKLGSMDNTTSLVVDLRYYRR